MKRNRNVLKLLLKTVHLQKEWAEAKKELQEEHDNVRKLMLDRDQTLKNSMKQVEEMGKELASALHAVAAAETRAAVAEVLQHFLSVLYFLYEVLCSEMKFTSNFLTVLQAKLSDLEKRTRSSDSKVHYVPAPAEHYHDWLTRIMPDLLFI